MLSYIIIMTYKKYQSQLLQMDLIQNLKWISKLKRKISQILNRNNKKKKFQKQKKIEKKNSISHNLKILI